MTLFQTPTGSLTRPELLEALRELRRRGLVWHLDDDPREILWRGGAGPLTREQAGWLRSLVVTLNAAFRDHVEEGQRHCANAGAWAAAEMAGYYADVEKEMRRFEAEEASRIAAYHGDSPGGAPRRAEPDEAAVLGIAMSLHKEGLRHYGDKVSAIHSGCDQFMRECMAVARVFETWACHHVDFNALNDVWPYLLQDRFGKAALPRIGSAPVGTLGTAHYPEIARTLGLRLRPSPIP